MIYCETHDLYSAGGRCIACRYEEVNNSMGMTLNPPPPPPWKDCEACDGAGRVQFGNYLEEEARARAATLGFPLRLCQLCEGKRGSGVRRPVANPKPQPPPYGSPGTKDAYGATFTGRRLGDDNKPICSQCESPVTHDAPNCPTCGLRFYNSPVNPAAVPVSMRQTGELVHRRDALRIIMGTLLNRKNLEMTQGELEQFRQANTELEEIVKELETRVRSRDAPEPLAAVCVVCKIPKPSDFDRCPECWGRLFRLEESRAKILVNHAQDAKGNQWTQIRIDS